MLSVLLPARAGAQSLDRLGRGAVRGRRLPLGARCARQGPRALPRRRTFPGAAFLDVEADLSDLSVPGRGPASAALGGALRRRGVACRHRRRARSSSRTARSAAPSGSGGCSGISATTTAPCSSGGLAAWGGPLRGGDEEIEPAEFVPRERDERHDRRAEEIARRLADPSLVLVDARTPNRWRGEPNPVDDPRGPHPRRAERALGGAAARSCRTASSSRTAAPASRRASRSIAPGSQGREGRLYPGSWSEWSQRGLPVERELGRRRVRDGDVGRRSSACRARSRCAASRLAAANGIGGVDCRLRRSTARRRASGPPRRRAPPPCPSRRRRRSSGRRGRARPRRSGRGSARRRRSRRR